ncbi:MAG: glycosyltransferase family 4 protein [Planctomycetota bacterium]|jgi:glycosyltransferase involved in cell wall biosynthesis
MRWLIVSSRQHPDEGGIGAYVTRFAGAAAQAGWDVHLLTRAGGRPPAGATVHTLATVDEDPDFAHRVGPLRAIDRIRPYRAGLWALAVAEHLAARRPDVDAVEFVDTGAEGVVALASRRVRAAWAGVPMLLSCRTPMWVVEGDSGLDPRRFGRRVSHRWERRAARDADACFAPSRRLRARVRAARATSCAVIPDLAPPAGPAVAAADGRERILLVGDVHPNKGVDTWARSLDRVLRARPAAEAVLVGPDTAAAPDGGSMTRHVLGLVDPALRPRVTCLGPRPHDRVRRLIAAAAVVVVPSRFESFSSVAAEAIVSGRPVVVSERVGLLEHVPSLPRVPADDPRRLADAQLAVLAAPDAAAARIERCRRELRTACDPRRLLAARAELVAAARARPSVARPRAAGEAMDAMRRYLRAVEARERAGGRPAPAGIGR